MKDTKSMKFIVTAQPSNTVMPAGKRASSHMDVNDLTLLSLALDSGFPAGMTSFDLKA